MAAKHHPLLAQTVPDLVAINDVRGPLRVLIASLAMGGAERIVCEWLAAEAGRGRAVELGVLHARHHAWRPPPGVTTSVCQGQPLYRFVAELAERWADGSHPVSTHLVGDDLLAELWRRGVRTIPVVHNVREGWRNDPVCWLPEHVPCALACADVVRRQLLAAGCRVPVYTVRHRPALAGAAFDPLLRETFRKRLGVPPDTLLVGAVGAIKPQKDYCRSLRVIQALNRRRPAVLVTLGGVLDRAGCYELDRLITLAAELDLADRLRLPGFVHPIEPYYAACDAMLNVSRYEGLSMATSEALTAGLPVVATDVGGQREIGRDGLTLVAADADVESIAAHLADLPVRTALEARPLLRTPRIWSCANAWSAPTNGAKPARVDTLFITANLNAGGAQRSLVNLASGLIGRHRLAIAVCGETTHPAFPLSLTQAGVTTFRPATASDPFDVAESLLSWATAHGVRTLCLWNVDPKVKLLLARFAPEGFAMVDVSPGAYAFEELDAAAGFQGAVGMSSDAYYDRLNALVLKYHEPNPPRTRRTLVIPNGVTLREHATPAPGSPRFLVSGRIAPSKRLETILEAFTGLHLSQPTAELHLVGQAEPRHQGYLEALLERAAGLPVQFRGAMPDLAYLAEPFTVALVLGTHQGSPNAVLEAMSAGIPVIANTSGGTAELVHHGETGWLLPEACSAEELILAMHALATDPTTRNRLGLAAQRLVREHFSLETMVERYFALFA